MKNKKILMLTVPHSGTRWITNSFRDSGYEATSSLERVVNKDMTLCWQHWMSAPKYWNRILQYNELAEASFFPMRDPIMTWATHFGTLSDVGKDAKRKKDLIHNYYVRQRKAYVHQLQYCDQLGMQYFRVDKDPWSVLQEITGMDDLEPIGKKESKGTYPLKEACKARDIDRIKYITEGTLWWEKLHDLTAVFGEQYQRAGYDLWWVNG